jgi:hypothetical protein
VEEPLVVQVQHLVLGLDVAPVPDAEDPVRVVAVLADAEKLDRKTPAVRQIFFWKKSYLRQK